MALPSLSGPHELPAQAHTSHPQPHRHPPTQHTRTPACTSAWKVSAPMTLANQVLRALMSTDSGSRMVMERTAARSVRGTPTSRSITSSLEGGGRIHSWFGGRACARGWRGVHFVGRPWRTPFPDNASASCPLAALPAPPSVTATTPPPRPQVPPCLAPARLIVPCTRTTQAGAPHTPDASCGPSHSKTPFKHTRARTCTCKRARDRPHLLLDSCL